MEKGNILQKWGKKPGFAPLNPSILEGNMKCK